MSEANKAARIEYLQSLYRSSAAEVERLRAALTEINSQAVCAVIATEGECFDMLQNCAEISDLALAVPPADRGGSNNG